MKKTVLAIFMSSSISLYSFAGAGHEQMDMSGSSHEDMDMSGDHHDVSTSDHGVGKPANPAEATRHLPVSLTDSMDIDFGKNFDIKPGDIIEFIVTNKGNITHEFSIGSAYEQAAHAKIMRDMPNMVHSDGSTISLAAGETKNLTWRFGSGERVVFSCNVPGHFEAGMHHEVDIESVN